VNFKNSVIVMTSNIGSAEIQAREPIGRAWEVEAAVKSLLKTIPSGILIGLMRRSCYSLSREQIVRIGDAARSSAKALGGSASELSLSPSAQDAGGRGV